MPRELYHNTREQVVDYLRAAIEIVEELDPPADLREEMFRSAVAMLGAKTINVQAHDVSPVLLGSPAGPPH